VCPRVLSASVACAESCRYASRLGWAGTSLEPLSVLKYNSADDAIVLPDDAWSQDKLLPCLAEVAMSSAPLDELPARADEGEQLLDEQSEPMEAGALHSALERLMAYAEQAPASMSSVVRTLITHAQFDGPFKLVGGPTAAVDLATFNQHLSTIAACLNTLHDQKVLGEYMQSPHFKRTKYELYALQHMQLLVWLHRVQQGLAQGMGKSGAEASLFVGQIAHAARVILFQPLLVHVLQIVHDVVSLPNEEVGRSMRLAMTYPPDSATDADRVEWLQLNLLLQFQTLYKTALCNASIYQTEYSPGEQQLLAGLLRLEEIYTHLIGRFPTSCPLSEQEQAVLAELCRKLNT
jgi:hypothetical protein